MKPTPLNEIYLDNNATTPVLAIAAQAAQDAMQSIYGNPSSSHITGLKARYILDSTRLLARQVLGANTGKIIFLSGATEGIQTTIFSALCQVKQRIEKEGREKFRYLLYGATEHKAVPNSLSHWNNVLEIGAEPLAIPVDENGKLDYEFIEKHLNQTAMICTMAVNNETGVMQNLSELEKVIRDNNPDVLWMVDSVQALGKLDLQLDQTSIDYAPFSGHKLYAPKGIGMLYVRENAPLTPFIAGGGQEQGMRSGTENLPGVAAFGAILQELNRPQHNLFQDHETLSKFRQQLVSTLKEVFPGIVFNMPFDTSVPTTLNFSIKDFPSKEILDLFDAAQIRVSSGSACSSGVTRSYVLDAMRIPGWRSESAIRMSFGPATTQQEIDQACQRIREAADALTQSCLILNTLETEEGSPRQNGLIQLKKEASCIWIYADAESRSCVIIDPVEELGERLVKFIKCQGYQVKAILDTHSHADHESCRTMLQQILSDHLAHAPDAYDALGWPTIADTQVTLDDGSCVDAITLGQRVMVRVSTPGHTSDSHSYLLGNSDNQKLLKHQVEFAFVGDTILIGGLGRTNFSSSDSGLLFDSIQKLDRIIDTTTLLCSAHDYNNQFTTTLATESNHNALLFDILNNTLDKSTFIERKQLLDQKLNDQVGHEILCGVVNAGCNLEGLHILPEELGQFLTENPNIRLVDVREAHEYQLFHDWSKLNMTHPPENVPLSKMTSFIGELLRQDSAKDIALLFVCRSGARSAKIAETFRRLGFNKTRHISGGVALSCC